MQSSSVAPVPAAASVGRSRFVDKSIVVTGAGGAIGEAIAAAFISEGGRVAAVDTVFGPELAAAPPHLLRVVADLDVNEVADIVGKLPGNVRVLTHRGLKLLHEMLKDGGDRL